jgi:hypothetical protein
VRRVASLVAAAGLLAACSSGDDASSPTTNTISSASGVASTVAVVTTEQSGQTRATPATTSTTTTVAPTTTFVPTADALPAVERLLRAAEPLRRFTLGPDTLGVWICHVAVDITDPIYNQADLRLTLTPDGVADQLNQFIGPYFRTLSDGQYQPTFVAGGEVSIAKGQNNNDCVEQAQHDAGDDIDGLVVIADAEHGANQPGGWGRPGTACDADEPCPANVSGRATYIGASDFHPDWGTEPAVDLEEHEIGHSLGFPHSGDEGGGYTSALDLMSNSAAPRDVDPDRRDGPDTLGVNRLAAGWLPLDGVAVAARGGEYELVPSNAATGPRLLILPLDEYRFVTVELLVNSGFDAHLPESGIAIHLVNQRPNACHSTSSTTSCVNEEREQLTLGSTPPHTDLLTDGETVTVEGWAVRVVSTGESWTVAVS